MSRWPSEEEKRPAAPEAAADRETITGVVQNIVYRSEVTGYTVCSVKVSGRADPVTVVGHCAAVWTGETIRAEGQWVRHRKHGLQLQADQILCVVPNSAAGIEKYLAGGMIRGVGKELARRIVEKFGDDTLRVIEKESQRLEEVEGIGPHRRKMIKESWVEQQAVRDIMIFLQSHGIGTAQAARIYRQYGAQAIALITENPYRLCRDIWGIGFKTADSVAMSLGIPPDAEIRAREGLIYVLRTMSENGHCYCPTAHLMLEAQSLLNISTEVLDEALKHDLQRGYLVQEDERVYLTGLYRAEVNTAQRIRRIQATPQPFRPIEVDRAIPWAEARMNIRFDPGQADALRTALSNKISIMTGGPGVGKTTIIRALVDIYEYRKLRVLLAAPTGRAAKRMEEATRHEARTLHRLLKFTPQLGGFEHNADNPLEGDVFILDEVSMIDIHLISAFLDALPDSATLILVGDIDQLPSVGPGNVLRDMIHSDRIPFRRLETIFRQEQSSLIVQNAHLVNRGENIITKADEALADFFFIETDDPDEVVRRVVELVARRIPRKFGFDPMTDIQVLTPMRRNQLGADNMNIILQEALNPVGESILRFGRHYRLRDRVMQIRNNYDKDVYNGDIGWIETVNKNDQELVVNFEGRRIPYDFTELDELVHAYATSIHKSQGSEYPAVVLMMATQHYRLLQRNLLYTGLTRGRKLVCLVGSRKAVWIATRNNEPRRRLTSLRERIIQAVRD